MNDTNMGGSEPVSIKISHRNNVTDLEFEPSEEAMDLFTKVADLTSIPVENQKFMVPKGGMLKWPLKDPHQSIRDFAGKKLMLMGAMGQETKAVQDMSKSVQERDERRLNAMAKQKQYMRRQQHRPTTHETKYTFHQVRPLNNLPRPERSLNLLERLKRDPGIVATMRKHEFQVGLLTEMEPLSHTQSNHEGTSRILGLNRNKGEVIELRLRTDAYDGYRDYKTIRKTLCHELTHNVHSEHDRKFWDLCRQIEREVDQADWKSGGHTVGETSAYHRSGHDEEVDDHADDGGWTGGEFVLGGVRDGGQGMSRREILAKAATERQRKDDRSEQAADCGWRPCQKRPQRGSGDDEETTQ